MPTLPWIAFLGMLLALPGVALARDDGRWAGSNLKQWFEGIKNPHGVPCCDIADGRRVDGPDWGTEPVATADGQEIRYWVRVDGQKLIVPPDAVVTEPNKFGDAVVWPWSPTDGVIRIRCFMPGAEG